MKQGWEVKSLGEIADVEYGFTDKSTEKGDYRYVRITDIDNNGQLILDDKKYLQHSKEAEGFLIQDNDLLMARTGATFAKVLLYKGDEPSVFASYLIKIKFKVQFENKLYWYFTKSKNYWDQANSLQSGAAQPHFNGAAVKQVIFSYPKSFEEQKHIVSILDTAFEAIEKAKANAEQNLKNSKELFESYLQNVFSTKGEGWEEKLLNEITEVKDGTHDSPKYINEGIPFVTQKNIKQDGLSFADTKFITDNDHEKFYKRSNVTHGDILISMIGANRGMAAIVDDKRIFSIKNVGLIKESKNINNQFLLYYLKSSLAMKYVLYMSNGGAQEFIGLTALRSFPIPYPPVNEQQTIVQKLDALSSETKKLEAIYQQKLIDLEELKKSLLEKAFKGELKTEKIEEF